MFLFLFFYTRYADRSVFRQSTERNTVILHLKPVRLKDFSLDRAWKEMLPTIAKKYRSPEVLGMEEEKGV